MVNTLDANADEHDIAYSISSIGRAINQQLLKQAEEHLGQAPVAYAWVVAGSLARSEQTIHSDQDNLLIINDDFQPKIQGDYFVKLAKYVCDGIKMHVAMFTVQEK
ncbi:DUF294 nucleotidyltransferase-like domain-containing protein [Abyssogena phaseoliformis symbiont]|uniref:DUF294 nucleotidyltransferase-like domain-containing protein n=1 Tax=Abyssogena phaseoliformis symbiont TaxID=596095 RepID=UPI001914E3D2|nr:DUF294 nucleotidyltransferase-like domain-containing protein [Abyssogena phaseoliformis symbiont]